MTVTVIESETILLPNLAAVVACRVTGCDLPAEWAGTASACRCQFCYCDEHKRYWVMVIDVLQTTELRCEAHGLNGQRFANWRRL